MPVKLETLIEQIYVSPGRPQWFRELVADILKRYELESLPVETSSLDARPDLA